MLLVDVVKGLFTPAVQVPQASYFKFKPYYEVIEIKFISRWCSFLEVYDLGNRSSDITEIGIGISCYYVNTVKIAMISNDFGGVACIVELWLYGTSYVCKVYFEIAVLVTIIIIF